MANGDNDNGRTHEPNLRELTSDLDGLKNLFFEKVKSLRDLMDERHSLYKERADSQKTAVDDALAAQKEQTSAAFVSSEKAIVKAEEAQTAYNTRSNEFRGTLDDQAKLLLSRTEYLAAHDALMSKIDTGLRSVNDKTDLLTNRMTTMEARTAGITDTRKESQSTAQWNTANIFNAATSILALVSIMLYALWHSKP